ncbi:MAG: hypothetical protein ACTSU4_11705 [Promethearchaeota archaeon]
MDCIEENCVERNARLIEERMIEQMEQSLAIGRKLIDSELNAGIFDFIVKPIVKTFYDYWSENDAREGTLEQIKVTLECGKLLLRNGLSEENFNSVIEEYFPKYLAGDQTSRQCKKNHKNYKKLKEITKKTFISQVKEVIPLLKVDQKEGVESYDDLCRIALKTKENAHEKLSQQFEFTEEAIQIVERDMSILKIPTGKKIICKSLRKGFEHTKKELMKEVERIFNQ